MPLRGVVQCRAVSCHARDGGGAVCDVACAVCVSWCAVWRSKVSRGKKVLAWEKVAEVAWEWDAEVAWEGATEGRCCGGRLGRCCGGGLGRSGTSKARGCEHECMEGVQTVKEEREKSLKREATAASSTLPL